MSEIPTHAAIALVSSRVRAYVKLAATCPQPNPARPVPGTRLDLMSTTTPPAADLYVVVGYDGSPPANRALDAAVGLLRGRTGRIEVVYVTHLSSTAMLSAGAVAELEAGFDQIEQELRTAAQERLRGG